MPNEPDPLAEDLKAVERFEAAREASAKAFRSASADQKDRTYDVSVSRAEMNKRACERFPAVVRELARLRALVAACGVNDGDLRANGECVLQACRGGLSRARIEGAAEAWTKAGAEVFESLKGWSDTLPSEATDLLTALDAAKLAHLAELGSP